MTCDFGFRRWVEEEEEEEEDESSPSFFFLSRWRVHPNDYLVVSREKEETPKPGRGRGEGIDFFELSKVL